MKRLSRLLKRRTDCNDPRQVRNVMLSLWVFFVCGSILIACIRFFTGTADFERAFGFVPASILGNTIGTALTIALSYLSGKE